MSQVAHPTSTLTYLTYCKFKISSFHGFVSNVSGRGLRNYHIIYKHIHGQFHQFLYPTFLSFFVNSFSSLFRHFCLFYSLDLNCVPIHSNSVFYVIRSVNPFMKRGDSKRFLIGSANSFQYLHPLGLIT